MPKSPFPPGTFVELQVDNIDEGKFRKKLNATIRRAVKDLVAYEKEADDKGGKAVITAVLTVKRAKGTGEHFAIGHRCRAATPTVENITMVKMRGDRLLCQPIGSTAGDPDQQLMFDANGRVIGGVDPETGDVVEDTGSLKLPQQQQQA